MDDTNFTEMSDEEVASIDVDTTAPFLSALKELFSGDVTDLITKYCYGDLELGNLDIGDAAEMAAEVTVLDKFFKTMAGDGSQFVHNKDQLRIKLSTLMTEQNLKNIKTDKASVSNTPKVFASIPANKLEEGYAWLRDNGYDGIIKETVHPSTLAATMKQIMEEGKLAVPDSISVHIKPYVTIRLTAKLF